MVNESEHWLILRDGTKLFEKTWQPALPTSAHLIFLHGFSDRSEIQYDLFPALASPPLNITCHAIDQRGWGKSVHHPSQRGLTGPTAQVLADIDEYVQHVLTAKIDRDTDVPLFLMGHSMGGQQVLHYLLSTSSALVSRSKLAGAIVEAPYIALDPKTEPSRFLVIAGKIAAAISPSSQMKQDLDARYITRDPVINQAWKEDQLCHDYGTLQGLRDMLKRGADLVSLSSRSSALPVGLSPQLPVPIYWAHGTADRITAFTPSQRLFERLLPPEGALASNDVLGKTFKAYHDAYHKIHAEPNGVGKAFAQDIGEWIIGIAAARRVRDSTNSRSNTSNNTSDSSTGDADRSASEAAQAKLKAKL